MVTTLTPRRLLVALALAIVWTVPLDPAGAQTTEQMRQLEQLTPDQREAILKALDGVGAEDRDTPLTHPEVVTPRRTDGGEQPSNRARGTASEVPGAAADAQQALRPFGYDLFAGVPTTFAPATDIPVPVDYVIGPGDTVELQLFGNQNEQFTLVVGRDGVLNVPAIGPVTVAGLRFSELQQQLQQRVTEQMIGVRASITLGPLRSIRVFILGDAFRPGSYTVSALSTITNALFVSGGVKTIGSLRNVQLKRNGTLVTSLDLYDLLLDGDTSADTRLQPGDVIFIPPVGTRVGVSGEVRRPAIYELKSERTAADVLRLAGGMLPTAYPESSHIERINADRERTIIDVNLLTEIGLSRQLAADDIIQVFSVLEKKEDIVRLSGHVYRPGPYQWRDGMRLSDLIPSIADLQPKADLQYVLVRREDRETQEISAFSANLATALVHPRGPADVMLHPLDQVWVFGEHTGRAEIINPLLDELRLQARYDQPVPQVGVGGHIRAPGAYPLEDNMRISDLIRAGGYLDEAAYPVEAELTRYSVGSDQERQTDLIVVDLAAVLVGDPGADFLLQPRDVLNVKEIPLWRELEVTEVQGEVRFPGRYPIRRGERLSSLLQRAGGPTDMAFADGAVFLRPELRQREQQQIEELTTRLEGEIQAAQASQSGDDATHEARQMLLQQLKETQATGRLVIDLGSIIAGNFDENMDVVLRDGDKLLVPRVSQTVTIIGEVQFPTSHIYQSGIGRDDYISKSGGMTSRADKKRIYVVRADGSVVAANSSRFFRNRRQDDIRPGDTIVVPLEADFVSRLNLWTSVSTIFYNIAVAAAAVTSFNN